jgi:hypothetical protein
MYAHGPKAIGIGAVAVLFIVVLLGGFVIFFFLTPARTTTITFSYDASTGGYFAKAGLPRDIRGVELHVEFVDTAVPKITLWITDENGIPLRLVEGDLKFDAQFFADVGAWFKGLDGKQVNFFLSIGLCSCQLLSSPYLEVAYAPFTT